MNRPEASGPAAPRRRTKIVATLGPATDAPETIDRLLESGVDVFRLNASHGDHAAHARRIGWIRAAGRRHPRPIAILLDLQGPKVRLGALRGEVVLRPGEPFRFTRDPAPGDASRAGVTWSGLLDVLVPGRRVLLRDGQVTLEVRARSAAEVETVVVTGGALTSHSGINVPEEDLPLPALSEKDVEDLEFGVAQGIDWVALSFVRSAADLHAARGHLERLGAPARLMAKIEKPGAVARFDEVLAAADGIMIARGDLGVELRPEEVPVVQKRLIRLCIEAGKPVITATQMLQSMIDASQPTRAEVSDVANAVFDGTDAVMLSGETAVGQYPVAAVAMMSRIAAEVEASADYEARLHRYEVGDRPDVPDAMSHSAAAIARLLSAAVVAVLTSSGATAWRIARHRPRTLVAALTPDETVARQLALGWGLLPLVLPGTFEPEAVVQAALGRLRQAGLAGEGERIVLVSGQPFGTPGTTNTVRVETA